MSTNTFYSNYKLWEEYAKVYKDQKRFFTDLKNLANRSQPRESEMRAFAKSKAEFQKLHPKLVVQLEGYYNTLSKEYTALKKVLVKLNSIDRVMMAPYLTLSSTYAGHLETMNADLKTFKGAISKGTDSPTDVAKSATLLLKLIAEVERNVSSRKLEEIDTLMKKLGFLLLVDMDGKQIKLDQSAYQRGNPGGGTAKSNLTPRAILTLTLFMARTKVTNIRVTSIYRSPADQVRVMLQGFNGGGLGADVYTAGDVLPPLKTFLLQLIEWAGQWGLRDLNTRAEELTTAMNDNGYQISQEILDSFPNNLYLENGGIELVELTEEVMEGLLMQGRETYKEGLNLGLEQGGLMDGSIEPDDFLLRKLADSSKVDPLNHGKIIDLFYMIAIRYLHHKKWYPHYNTTTGAHRREVMDLSKTGLTDDFKALMDTEKVLGKNKTSIRKYRTEGDPAFHLELYRL